MDPRSNDHDDPNPVKPVEPDGLTERVWSKLTNEVVILRRTPDGRPVCPVCGVAWPSGAEHAWSGSGERNPEGLLIVAPSYDICPSCKTEFGNDDIPDSGESLADSWAWLRGKWLEQAGRSMDVVARLKKNLGVDI